MEDPTLPPKPITQPSVTSDALETIDPNQPVSSFELNRKDYPIENLEVRRQGEAPTRPVTYAPSALPPISRRRAMIISLAITLVVVLITGAVFGFFIVKESNRQERSASTNVTPAQDITLSGRGEQSELPGLQGTKESLFVNGNLVTRGTLKVISGNFTSTIASQTLAADQTVTLPNASGVICLDVNNCNFATQAQIVQAGGVTSINNLAGGLTIQGSINRITVTTANGAVTLSTPQDLDANANVQFGTLTLTSSLSVASGGTGTNVLTANGLLLGNGTGAVGTVVAAGAGQCLLSTAGAPAFQACPGGGGGGVTSLNSLTGALTLQGTANQINVASVGTTITLSTPQDIATTSNVTFNGLTLAASADINGGIALGSNATIDSTTNALVLDHNITGNCSFGCSGILLATRGNAASVLTTGVNAGVEMNNAGAFLTAAFYARSTGLVGTGGSVDNYGVFVGTQTAGANDYGVYIQGADTYGLWVDSGATRLDGTLEVQTLGATNTATFLCRNSSNQLAACNTTGAGAAFIQGGNNFGGTGTLGLTSNNDLNVITNSLTRLTVQNDGDLAVDTNTLFVDATNNRVGINDGAPSFALDVVGDTSIVGHLGVGDNAAPSPVAALGLVENYTSSDNCGAFGCYGILLSVTANNPSGANDGIVGVYSSVSTAAASFTIDRTSAFSAAPTSLGAGSTIIDNYGVLVQNQTAGNNDYGIYIEGADTYALWIDNGISRFDGDAVFDTNTLFVDAANNRVGIGTATPAAPLEVSTSANNYTRINETGAGAYNLAFSTNAFGKIGTIAQAYALNITSDEQVTIGPSATPRLVVNTSEANGAGIVVNPQSATQVGAVIKGFASQTADLLQFQNSSNVAMLMINPSGQLVFEGSTDNAFETTIAVADPAADRTYTIPDSTASTDTFCLLTLGNCFGLGTGGTLQAAYTAGNTITTSDNRNILFTLADTTTDSDFIVNIQGTGNIFEVQDGGTPIFTVADAGVITIGDINGSAGERILGAFNNDFSGINEGTYFQNFYSNSNTYLQVRPSGTATESGIAFTGADTNSTGHLRYIEDTDFSLVSSDAAGSSAGVPITFVIKEASGGDSEVMRLTSTGQVGIGTASPDARLELAGNESQAAWGLNGIQLQASSATYTDTGTTGTRTSTVVNSFGRPTFASTNAVTSTYAATVYIQNSPLASGNHAVTNPYSLWVDDGDARFDGNNLTVGDVLGGGGISMYSQDPLAIYESQPSISYGRDGNKPWTLVVGPAGNSFEIFGGGHTSGDNVATFELGGGFHVCCDSNGARLSPSNSATTPAYTFSNDGDTGIYHDAADTISFSTATTKRFDITSAGLLPGAASTYDLGSSTLEFDELYLGDNTGLKLGLDQDATLAYDEATDDRVELTGSGASLFIEDRLVLGVQTFTMATAGAATENLTPTSSYVEVTGQDNAADLISIQTGSAKEGDVLIINNTSATNVSILAEATSKLDTGANRLLTQYDVITLVFDGTNWLQTAPVSVNS
jgi:hypothetical protein